MTGCPDVEIPLQDNWYCTMRLLIDITHVSELSRERFPVVLPGRWPGGASGDMDIIGGRQVSTTVL